LHLALDRPERRQVGVMPRMRRSKRASSAPLIALHHCSLILDDHVILDDVSFELRAGERWALIGPNGSGKTFLLKMLSGDVWPTPTGRERRIYRLAGRASDQPAGSKEALAYIGPERQDKYLRYDWNFTVREIVTTGLFHEDRPLSKPNTAQRARVDRLLKRFGIHRWRDRRLLTLSYGQRRLVLIARAFAARARVLLLDEVFNGLDAQVRRKLLRVLETRTRAESPVAWVLTTHRTHELPASITHVARIQHGRLTYAGPIDEAKLGAVRSTRIHVPDVKPRTRPRVAAPLISIRNADIYRDYRPVLKNVNWTIEQHEHWAVFGANGSGKSTLLSLLYGDLHPALGGSIERLRFPPGTHIEAWKRRVGWVSPELQAEQYLVGSIAELVMSGRYASVGLNDAPTAADRRAAARWLKFFALQEFAHRKPRQVSYGQLRLALIARAMVNQPELLLLDEPCTGLDQDLREQILVLLERLARRGTQIVMAVHDREDIIPSIKHVLRIRKGGEVVIETL
jgi:molybdate transport system ATP-binding protein